MNEQEKCDMCREPAELWTNSLGVQAPIYACCREHAERLSNNWARVNGLSCGPIFVPIRPNKSEGKPIMNDKRKQVHALYAELLKAGWNKKQVDQATDVHMLWWEKEQEKKRQDEAIESADILETHRKRMDERFNGLKDYNQQQIDKLTDKAQKRMNALTWKLMGFYLIVLLIASVVAAGLTRLVLFICRGN